MIQNSCILMVMHWQVFDGQNWVSPQVS
jgi:hypothetical protein